MKRNAANIVKTSLLTQLVTLILSTALLLLFVALIFNRFAYSRLLIDEVKHVEEDYMYMQADNLAAEVRKMNNSLIETVIDSKLLKAIKQYAQTEPENQAALILDIKERLSDHASDSDAVIITVVLPDNTFAYHTRLQGQYRTDRWFCVESRPVGFNDDLFALNNTALETHSIQVSAIPGYHDVTGTYVVHFAYPMIDLYSKKIYGSVVLTFRTDRLQDVTNPINTASHREKISHGVLVLEDGTVLAHADKNQIGKLYAPPEDMLAFSTPLRQHGLTLYRVIDQAALSARSNRNTGYMTLLMGFIIALYVLVTVLTLRRMMRSIRELRSGLERVQEGDFHVAIPCRTGNEIGQITVAFNTMAAQLQEMDERRKMETDNKIQAMNDLRVAEIRALENQINSHFLYNTLNTINYTAIQHDDYPVSNQIKHLAQMLRYTFDRSDKVVEAKREAAWLCEYLSLQKVRFGSAFDYRITVEESVAAWPMKKLVLQPFVENSILHGFAGRTHGGFLSVDFQAFDGDRLRVTIRDNGKGICGSRLAHLQSKISANSASEDSHGIGLENAFLRIRSYYDNAARIFLRSWEGQGTTVVLLLPPLEKG